MDAERQCPRSQRGSLLYSLFAKDCRDEVSQLLSQIDLSLFLEYNYDNDAKASDFTVEGILRLGHLTLDTTYIYPANGDWDFTASLRVGGQTDGSLLGVLASLCGTDLASVLPEFISKIKVRPVGAQNLTSLRIAKLETGFVLLVRLQVTATISVAYYQYQPKKNPDQPKPPPARRALVFSLAEIPKVDGIPLVGSLPQPFDEARFLWISGGADNKGWTRAEVSAVNAVAAGFPPIIFREQQETKAVVAFAGNGNSDAIVLKSGFHLCLIQGGETVMDKLFWAPKPDPNLLGMARKSPRSLRPEPRPQSTKLSAQLQF